MRRILVIAGLVALALLIAGALFAFTRPPSPESPGDGPYIPPHISSRFAPPGQKHYWNAEYQFSLFHPESFTVVEHPEANRAGTIVFQDSESLAGFQVYVVPYFTTAITDEQFLKDMPSGVREDEHQVFIDGREFVVFRGEDGVLGETLEVWGIEYGFLYEITAQTGNEALMEDVVASWRFF